MKKKKTLKSYIYERDKHICHFCGKELLFKQVSLDHYLPRSKSGPDEVFNLVLSCRRCNKFKKSSVPDDYPELLVELFKKGVEDKQITLNKLQNKPDNILSLIKQVDKLEDITENYCVFQSANYRFYVKRNNIIKIIQLANLTK